MAEPGVSGIVRDVLAGRRAPRDIVAETLDGLGGDDGGLNAVLGTRDRDAAITLAVRVEEALEGGAELPLAGVPLGVKDNIARQGDELTCGSRLLEGHRAARTATALARLEAAGAIPVCRTNLDEFAMGSSNENSAFGPVQNPWDRARAPGGSSGGSAAAVAAGLVPAALGSDTGGSIRQPAAFCGLVGVKPTYGRVSRSGLVAFASSLDQIGPLTRSVEDAARLLKVMAGHDPADATSARQEVGDYVAAVTRPVRGLKIGVPACWLDEGVDDDVRAQVRAAADRLAAAGAELAEVQLPHAAAAIPTYYVVASSEASSNLSRFDGVHDTVRSDRATSLLETYVRSRGEGFGAEVERRILLGTYALSAGYRDDYYERAMRVRELLRRDFAAAFAEVDLLLGPTVPTPAFRLGERLEDPLSMYLSDVLTVTANLTGSPALSLPTGTVTRDGKALPVAVQLTAAPFREDLLFTAAGELERSRDAAFAYPGVSS